MSASTGCERQRRAVILVWVPVLLAFPLLSLTGGPARVGAQVVLVAGAAVVAVVAVMTSRSGRSGGRSVLAFGALVVLVAAQATQGEGWQTGWGLAAIIAPAVLRGRWLLGGIVVLVSGAAVSIATFTNANDTLWLSVGGVALAGASTTSLLRLLESNQELRRTREELARVAVAEERERFSRDLHDLLGHTLSVMVVKAQAVTRLAGRDPQAAAAHAADIEQVGRRALVDVRAAVDQMRFLSLADELDGARDALDAAGISTAVRTCPVPPAADRVLAWAVRECATNVWRHSGAAHCRFEVTDRAGEIRLRVSDDGVGAVPAPGRDGGLDGLRRRLVAAGGWLDVRPGSQGFLVEAGVPTS